MTFTLFDFIVFGILALSALVAAMRGLLRDALGLISWIGAFYAAARLFGILRPHIADQVTNEVLTDLITVLIVFFVPLIIFKLATSMVSRWIDDGPLSSINRFAGLLFGLARGALVVCAAYLIASLIVDPEVFPEWVSEAYVHEPVADGARFIASLLPEDIAERANEALNDTIERAQSLRDEAHTGPGGNLVETVRDGLSELTGSE